MNASYVLRFFAAITMFLMVASSSYSSAQSITSTIPGWSEKAQTGEITIADVAPSGGGDLSTLDASKVKISDGTGTIAVKAVVGKAEPTKATVFVEMSAGAFGSFNIDLDGDGANEAVFEIPQPDAVKATAVWEKTKERVSEVVVPYTAGTTYVVVTAKGIGDFTKTAPTIDGPDGCFKVVASEVKSTSVLRALVEFPALIPASRAICKVGMKVGSDPRSAIFEFKLVSRDQKDKEILDDRVKAGAAAAVKVAKLEKEQAARDAVSGAKIAALEAEIAKLKAPVESFAGTIQSAVAAGVSPIEQAMLEQGNRIANLEQGVGKLKDAVVFLDGRVNSNTARVENLEKLNAYACEQLLAKATSGKKWSKLSGQFYETHGCGSDPRRKQ
ncbi:MAG: hypothetical protein COT91_00980 [Candidatus Doudnabacteria bacterium CG10_big_fil_rev_8_21_14_0_10_41_10]|uniref:DUF5667 domain-containing protein n=1 Tax=Candidatus Doudnabacteria bacterium CG10_big_fil_rev_8_21_14_0_10_41_10 TaxID=1974551 RepID=A0A2H0VEJ7_9BACT|nr:MAG: hypothetical protein COT91_00980 [Candidatus Doudnabacteria bacterium CG10_big_fil_rev_8_21_14_0_10_41_10]